MTASTEMRRHPASHAVDADLTTAWQESVRGDGTGEWIELRLARPASITRIEVYGGFQARSRTGVDLFRANNRPSRLTISVGPHYAVETDVPDAAQALVVESDVPTELSLNPAPSDVVRVTIDAVHRGTRWNDLCISEVRVFEPEGGSGSSGAGEGETSGMRPGTTPPPPGFGRKTRVGPVSPEQASALLFNILPGLEGRPSRECLSLVEDPAGGAYYSVSVLTSRRCSPDVDADFFSDQWRVRLTDGRVQRYEMDRDDFVDVPDVRVSEIETWSHPTKAVLARAGVELHGVGLAEGGTYATFDVTLRPLADTAEDRRWVRGLYHQLCAANAGFSFAMRDRRSGVRTTVECSGSETVGGSGLGW